MLYGSAAQGSQSTAQGTTLFARGPKRVTGLAAEMAAGHFSQIVTSRAEEHPIRGVAGLLHIGVVQLVEVPQEFRPVGRRHLDTREHTAVVGPVIAVVEQADVPTGADRLQEPQQRAGTLRELEAVKQLVLNATRVAAYHVAH